MGFGRIAVFLGLLFIPAAVRLSQAVWRTVLSFSRGGISLCLLIRRIFLAFRRCFRRFFSRFFLSGFLRFFIVSLTWLLFFWFFLLFFHRSIQLIPSWLPLNRFSSLFVRLIGFLFFRLAGFLFFRPVRRFFTWIPRLFLYRFVGISRFCLARSFRNFPRGFLFASGLFLCTGRSFLPRFTGSFLIALLRGRFLIRTGRSPIRSLRICAFGFRRLSFLIFCFFLPLIFRSGFIRCPIGNLASCIRPVLRHLFLAKGLLIGLYCHSAAFLAVNIYTGCYRFLPAVQIHKQQLFISGQPVIFQFAIFWRADKYPQIHPVYIGNCRKVNPFRNLEKVPFRKQFPVSSCFCLIFLSEGKISPHAALRAYRFFRRIPDIFCIHLELDIAAVAFPCKDNGCGISYIAKNHCRRQGKSGQPPNLIPLAQAPFSFGTAALSLHLTHTNFPPFRCRALCTRRQKHFHILVCLWQRSFAVLLITKNRSGIPSLYFQGEPYSNRLSQFTKWQTLENQDNQPYEQNIDNIFYILHKKFYLYLYFRQKLLSHNVKWIFFEILVKITQCKSSKGIFPYSDQAIVTVRMVNLHNFPRLEMHPIFSSDFQLFSKDAKNAQASASKTGSFSRTLSQPQPLWTLPSFL